MWFRIEQNKDGSIATCTAVEGSLGSRGAVHYIEADTAESACKILLARYNATQIRERVRSRERRAKSIAAGLCLTCGSPIEAQRIGLARCNACTARHTQQNRDLKAGIRLKKRNTTPEDKIAAQLRTQERASNSAKIRGCSMHIAHRRILQHCLDAFDRMTPRLFREWLAEELHKAREKEQVSAQRRAARAKAA